MSKLCPCGAKRRIWSTRRRCDAAEMAIIQPQSSSDLCISKNPRSCWNGGFCVAAAGNNGAPGKTQRSGFSGERRSGGMSKLCPCGAKRRIWSTRRRCDAAEMAIIQPQSSSDLCISKNPRSSWNGGFCFVRATGKKLSTKAQAFVDNFLTSRGQFRSSSRRDRR